MDRTITVTGNGSLTLKPDTIRLLLHLEDTKETYGEAIALSAEQTEELYSLLEPLGICREDLKTLSFRVDTHYELKQDVEKLWKQELAGYRFSHSLKLDLPNADENLGKIINAITDCSFSPRVQFQHIVKDTESAKNHLIEKAVADARRKAEILARSAGVILGEILLINYSWDDFNFLSPPTYDVYPHTLDAACPNASVPLANNSVNIAPEDIKLSDTVNIAWKIQ